MDTFTDMKLPEDCQHDLRDERLRRLLDYWRSHCAGATMPSPSAIDPLDFPYILGYVALVDVEAEPRRYRYRLDGSILVNLSGLEFTGRYHDAYDLPEYNRFTRAIYDRVVNTGKPYAYRYDGYLDQKPFDEETLLLPLGQDGKVSRIIVAVIPGHLPLEQGQQLL